MVQVIVIISNHTGCGATSVIVNLGSGLARQGCRVLIGMPGQNEKLNNWLSINQELNPSTISAPSINNMILHSPLGLDLINLAEKPGTSSELLAAAEKLDYDYLLVLPASSADCLLLNELFDVVIACTDLSHANELEELKDLDEDLRGSKAKGITLILPNKIETKEWEHNSCQLFSLADHFGYEKIADPIPA
ncbi:MAG: hypothetical protein PHF24_08865 [Syntrophomonas sp.]|nr:hypothetical protein [Syntrophomonas sp.]